MAAVIFRRLLLLHLYVYMSLDSAVIIVHSFFFVVVEILYMNYFASSSFMYISPSLSLFSPLSFIVFAESLPYFILMHLALNYLDYHKMLIVFAY